MEFEKKHYYLAAFVLLIALIALKMHANERRRMRDLEGNAKIKIIPNGSIAMPGQPSQPSKAPANAPQPGATP